MSGHFSFTTRSPYYRPDGTVRHDLTNSHHPNGTTKWIAVDGEGVTDSNGHRYVLFGVGQEQIENPDGLRWEEIFEFIEPHAAKYTAFVGFYLGYDFTQWLKTFPEERARSLLTIDGRTRRKSASPAMRGKYLPVDLDGWQVDMLGAKRLQFRRKPCDCLTVKCEHKKGRWIYICDAGSYFQTSFLNVIDPKNWQHPIISPTEWETIVVGKEHRESAVLDDDMRTYNRLENEVLSRVMADLDSGFRKIDIHLAPSQWFGPGQAAQAWLEGRAPRRTELIKIVPDWFTEAAWSAYFGGWFEIFCHGIVPGISYEYDINSAYPAVIAALPCLLHGEYTRGTGEPECRPGELALVRARVWGDPANHVGAMLHRNDKGWISRPLMTEGWFWLHELSAAGNAGLLAGCEILEWCKYSPCDCQPPLWQVKNLYQMRLDVGKISSLGKSAKLVYNSEYGKFAQTVGFPVFGNPVYASLITAGCRTQILEAIASHPNGMDDVLMVATDAVFFRTEHPSLPISPALGEWDFTERPRLTLFKPGVYWDDKAREQLRRNEHVSFKARGISARHFAKEIARIDKQFQRFNGDPEQWPSVQYKCGFAMTTALQALVRGKWDTAGYVNPSKTLTQNSNPFQKRMPAPYPDGSVWRTYPHACGTNADPATDFYASVPYEKRFGLENPFSEESTTQWGISPDEDRVGVNMFRFLTGKE